MEIIEDHHTYTQTALLGQKLDQLLLAVSDVRATFITMEERVRFLETETARLDERVKNGDRDSKLVAAATGVAAAIIGIAK